MKHAARVVSIWSLAAGIACTASAFDRSKTIEVVVAQDGCPIAVSLYESRYSTNLGGSRREKGIRHSLQYSNSSERKVVAIRFGFLSFSVFDELIGRFAGVELDALEPGAERTGEWLQQRSGDFLHLTGVAYVDAVRFDDGTVWHADLDAVTARLQGIQEGFDRNILLVEGEGDS